MTRPMPRLTLLLVGLLIALVAAPAASQAASRNQIIRDCADDGQLQGRYTKSELRDARQNLPSDVAEYTDCADVLRRAELPDTHGRAGGAGGGGATPGAAGGGGGGGGGLIAPTTDEDRKQLATAASLGAKPVTVGGERVVPGAAGLHPGATRNGIPGVLIATLILLAAAGLALALPGARRAGPALWQRMPFPRRGGGA